MMKIFNRITTTLTSLSVAVLAFGLTSMGTANALACYQYNPNGFTTSQTPVFNNICGITSTLSSTQGNYPLGDEPNFVRIRQNTSGSPLGSSNPPLVDSLNTTCKVGDKFDVWTYIHNDASDQFNNNGSGSAVAHNVKLATDAPLGTSKNQFTFKSTVSASNAQSVTDTTTLICNGQPVELKLSDGNAVSFNNDLSQTSYGTLANSTVNGVTPIGSPGAMSTGIQWGCWNYRVVVVYQVTVVAPPTQPPSTPPSTPPTTPPTTPPAQTTSSLTPPTQLVNTGAGSIIGIFAAATALGYAAYRWIISPRFTR